MGLELEGEGKERGSSGRGLTLPRLRMDWSRGDRGGGEDKAGGFGRVAAACVVKGFADGRGRAEGMRC